VPEILNSHIAWYRAMQDPLIEDSVAAELFRLSSEHDGLAQSARKTLLGKQVGTKPGEGTIGCVRYVEKETIEPPLRRRRPRRRSGEAPARASGTTRATTRALGARP